MQPNYFQCHCKQSVTATHPCNYYTFNLKQGHKHGKPQISRLKIETYLGQLNHTLTDGQTKHIHKYFQLCWEV